MLVVCAGLGAVSLPADGAVIAGSRQAALIVQHTPFAPAVQLLSELNLGAGFVWAIDPGARLRVDAGLAIGTIGRSALLSGYRYRGLTTRSLWLSAGWAPAGRIGVTVTGRAVLSSYELTSLLFFYPELEVSPELTTYIGPRTRIDWALPVFYQFRHDLELAVGVGLRGSLGLEFRSR
jgi:hypothetical protein